MKTRRKTPEECPVCGADVPPGARACPECGADERSGWDEEKTSYDGLDLPDQAFEDNDAPKRPASKRRLGPTGVPVFWWIVGVVLMVVVIAWTLRR